MNGYLGYSGEKAIILGHRLMPHIIMALLLICQSIDRYLKKRFQINFISEDNVLGIIVKFFGLYIIVLEGTALYIPSDWGYDPTRILTLSGVLLFLFSFVIHQFKSRDYNVFYLQESQLDQIIKEVFHRHNIKIDKKDKEQDYIIDVGERKNPILTVSHRGFIKKYYELKFKRHKYIYNFDEVILDLKDEVMTLTKITKHRGVEELVTIIFFLIMIVVIYATTKAFP